MPKQDITCEDLVIGSGPGGSISALLLAQAGRDVILVEEGQEVPMEQAPSYSLQEMDLKYRHSGLTLSMDKEKVSYVEACCVGGASEINAGLYHRPLPETLDNWAKEYGITRFSSKHLEEYFSANEQLIQVSMKPKGIASALIARGAQKLGWKAIEIPRMWDYGRNLKQSMSQAIIPQFIKSGGRLISQERIGRLYFSGKTATQAVSRRLNIHFKNVFVCAGAIQSPLLLRRSGIKANVGNNLRMHPAVRVVARFNEDINDPNEGVPVYQVSEFKPQITLGGSYSGVPHLALWLSHEKNLQQQLSQWRRSAIFYTLITASTPGKVRAIPFLDQPWVSLPMGKADWALIKTGLSRLEELLKAAGAQDILKGEKINLSTIHLFCSCPMGEDVKRAAVNSFGKVHGHDNVYVNDASILPSTPGVNPQALIMALARRNIAYFLGK